MEHDNFYPLFMYDVLIGDKLIAIVPFKDLEFVVHCIVYAGNSVLIRGHHEEQSK